MAEQTFRSGDVAIAVDQTAVIRALSVITDGASDRFIARATDTLEPIEQGAMARWPVRTGLSKRSFRLSTEVRPGEVSVSTVNDARNRWGPYAYKIRWSKLTRAEIDAQIAAAVARVSDNHDAVRKAMQRKLWRKHGKGAPSDAERRKSPWVLYVRRPGIDAGRKLAIDCQADLDRLAGRAHGTR